MKKFLALYLLCVFAFVTGASAQYTGGEGDGYDSALSPVTTLTLVPAPIAYWPMDEGAGFTATDVVGGNVGTLYPASPKWVEGKLLTGLNFNGTNDFVSVPGSASLDITDAITVMGWFSRAFSGGAKFTGLEKRLAWRLVAIDRAVAATKWEFSIRDAGGTIRSVRTISTVPTDELSHVAGSFDGTTLSIFVGGVFDNSRTVPATTIYSTLTRPLDMGRRDGYAYYKGIIDEVRLFDVALAESDVKYFFDATSGGPAPSIIVTETGTGTAVVEGGSGDTYAVRLSTEPTADVTVTVTTTDVPPQLTPPPLALTFTSSTWNVPQTVTVAAVDDSDVEGAHTGTVGHTSTSADGDYNLTGPSVTVDIVDNDGSPAPAPTLAARWTLDEAAGPTAADASGNGNHGTHKAGPTPIAGHVGTGALRFDGVNDFVRVPDDATLDVTSDWTLMGWFNRATSGGGRWVGIEKPATYRLLAFGPGAASNWVCDFWDSAGVFHRVETRTPVSNGDWHHVACTFDGTNFKILVDGSVADAGTVALPTRVSTTAFDMGRRDGIAFYKGMMDDIRLYAQALSETQILAASADLPVARSETVTEDLRLESAAETPTSFALTGAYPNPFNPSTTITFAVPEASPVTVAVFDLLGRQVRVLTGGIVEAGAHEVTFEATDLPSGIYLVRMDTPQGQYVRKITLLK